MPSSREKASMTNPMILVYNDTKKRKLTTSRGEDPTTEYLLDYEYIKNHYRLIAGDLRRQKK